MISSVLDSRGGFRCFFSQLAFNPPSLEIPYSARIEKAPVVSSALLTLVLQYSYCLSRRVVRRSSIMHLRWDLCARGLTLAF